MNETSHSELLHAVENIAERNHRGWENRIGKRGELQKKIGMLIAFNLLSVTACPAK